MIITSGSVQPRQPGDRCRRWGLVLSGYEVGRDGGKKRKQRWIKFEGTKGEAKTQLASLLTKASEGVLVKPSKQTVSDYLTAWLERLGPHLRPSTRASYAGTIRKYLIPRLGPLPLQQLVASHLTEYYGSL